jgi:serine/threonine protein kinase
VKVSHAIQRDSYISVDQTASQTAAAGGYSFVWRVKEVATKKSYALKRTICADQERLRLARNEAALHVALPEHKHIVRCHASDECEDPKSGHPVVSLLLDYCPGTPCHNYRPWDPFEQASWHGCCVW